MHLQYKPVQFGRLKILRVSLMIAAQVPDKLMGTTRL